MYLETNIIKTKKVLKYHHPIGYWYTFIINLQDDCNKYDSTLLPNIINNMMVDPQTMKYKKANKYKQYFLADKGYDSKENKELLSSKGYIPLIPQNKRNIKDDKLLYRFTKLEKIKYKKRIIVENSYSWIKNIPKLTFLFESNPQHYLELLYIAYGRIIFNRYLC